MGAAFPKLKREVLYQGCKLLGLIFFLVSLTSLANFHVCFNLDDSFPMIRTVLALYSEAYQFLCWQIAWLVRPPDRTVVICDKRMYGKCLSNISILVLGYYMAQNPKATGIFFWRLPFSSDWFHNWHDLIIHSYFVGCCKRLLFTLKPKCRLTEHHFALLTEEVAFLNTDECDNFFVQVTVCAVFWYLAWHDHMMGPDIIIYNFTLLQGKVSLASLYSLNC